MTDILEEAAGLFKEKFEPGLLLEIHNRERAEFVKGQLFSSPAWTRTIADVVLPALHFNMGGEIIKRSAKCKYDATSYASELNGKAFVIENGKLKEFEPSDLKPEAKIILTANSNLASPVAFAQNMLVAEKVAHERHPASNVIVIGFYESGANFYENGLASFRRMDVLKKNGTSPDFISKTSKKQAELLKDLIIKHDGNGNVILRPDAAKILSDVSFYGYSGGALTNHDAVRLLRDWLKKGTMRVEREGRLVCTDEMDARTLIPRITLVGFGAADIAHKTSSDIEPSMIYLMGRDSDKSIAALGKAPYIGHDKEIELHGKIISGSATIINSPTDKKDLGGHAELNYLQNFQARSGNLPAGARSR